MTVPQFKLKTLTLDIPSEAVRSDSFMKLFVPMLMLVRGGQRLKMLCTEQRYFEQNKVQAIIIP